MAVLLSASIVITFTLGSLMLAGILPFKLLSLAWVLVAIAFAAIQAPLAGTALHTPVAHAVFGVFAAVFMVSCVVPPILAWRAAVAAARAAPGQARDRLTIVAIAAACPILSLITCALLGLAFAVGLISEELGSVALSLVFSIPLIVFAAGVTAAFVASADDTAASLRIATRWVLTGLWLLVGIQLAIVVAGLLGTMVGDQSLLAVASVASVLTVCFFAAYVPVSRRVLAFTAPLEPTDSMSRVLTPREREVLAGIAAGLSNARIAASLHLSTRTVDSHVTAIFDKLGLGRSADVNRRVQAAAAWIRARALDQDRADTR